MKQVPPRFGAAAARPAAKVELIDLAEPKALRLALEMRLEEIKVLKLVGATDAFVKRPFLYFGAIYGFGGSLVTAMVLSAALILLEAPLGALGSSYGAMVRFQGDEPAFYIGLVLVGVVMGVAGGLVASNQRLREINID